MQVLRGGLYSLVCRLEVLLVIYDDLVLRGALGGAAHVSLDVLFALLSSLSARPPKLRPQGDHLLRSGALLKASCRVLQQVRVSQGGRLELEGRLDDSPRRN